MNEYNSLMKNIKAHLENLNGWIMSISYFTICLIFIAFIGCKKVDERKPLLIKDGEPAPVTNVQVENQPGGAKITYTLPNDPDFSYVEAVYSRKAGKEMRAVASLYKSFLEIEGFADTKEYEVALYSVNTSNKRSTPVNIKITPLTPPISKVYETLRVRSDFGGVNVKFENTDAKEYVLYTLVKDSLDRWVRYDRLYSKALTRDYSIRGFEPEPLDFAFYLTDKWQNTSDTLFSNITPLYEEKFDKNWKHYPLPGDYYEPNYAARDITKIWDDNIANNSGYFIAKPGGTLPNWFTIDLQKPLKFSRIKVWQYFLTNYAYNLGNPRVFEIWGSNNPAQDGSWESWELLTRCESVKPSGSPPAVKTAEDEAYAAAGEDFNFPIDKGAFRFIRFKTLETWGNATNLLLFEITLYGQDPGKIQQ